MCDILRKISFSDLRCMKACFQIWLC